MVSSTRSSIPAELLRCVLWENLRQPGLERFELRRTQELWMLRGSILVANASGPAEARYQITCDLLWHTREAEVCVRDSGGERKLFVAVKDGCWTINGTRADQLVGAIDIDLGWTPSTNTLPIRRLSLRVGASSGPVIAAWIKFPDLEVEPLPQEYIRLDEERYLYTSRGGAFKTKILVDHDGVVREYQNFWRQVS